MAKIKITLDLIVKYDDSMIGDGPNTEEMKKTIESGIIDFNGLSIKQGDELPFQEIEKNPELELYVDEVIPRIKQGYIEIKTICIGYERDSKSQAKKEMKKLQKQYAFIKKLGSK